jgi:dihydrofolate reductase
MSEAKRAAGDKNVLVHGAGTAQLALAAGVLDELEIHLIPVLLGQCTIASSADEGLKGRRGNEPPRRGYLRRHDGLRGAEVVSHRRPRR